MRRKNNGDDTKELNFTTVPPKERNQRGPWGLEPHPPPTFWEGTDVGLMEEVGQPALKGSAVPQ